MEGIINLHKPVGITSAKALYRVRAVTGQRKSGHGGTLDPAASGVLLLCLGKATKLVERIMDQPKVYRATARLDVTSESFDADRPLIPVAMRAASRGLQSARPYGRDNVAEPKPDPGLGLGGDPGVMAGVPGFSDVAEAMREFEGEVQQIPPAISAVKVGGQPAYKRKASEGPLDLKPRRVRIYWIHLHGYEWPMIDFEMCCGRGTYVRALIRDLGERLGTGGCLMSLVRTRVGQFELDHSWTLDDIARQGVKGQGSGAGGDSGASQSTIDNRQSTMGQVANPPYLIPLDEAQRRLDPSRVIVPLRP